MKRSFLFVGLVLSLGLLTVLIFRYPAQRNVNEPGREPQVSFLASTKFNYASIDDVISDVAFTGDGKIIATQLTYGDLLLFDQASKTWKPYDGFQRSPRPLRSVFFSTAKTGFISGKQGTLLKTIDGGETWTQLAPVSNLDLGKGQFPTPEVGYLTAEYTFIGKDEKMIYTLAVLKTEDGGNNWREVYKTEKEGYANLFDMAAASADTCLLSLGKNILRTEDGGKT